MQVQLTSSTYYSVELVQVQGFKIQTPRSIHQPIVFNLPCIILIVTGMGSPQLAIIRNHNKGKIFTGLNPAVQRLLACLDVWLLVRLSPSRCQIPLRCLDVFIGKPRRWTRTGFEGSSTWATELFTSQATSKLGVCHTPSRKLPYSHQHSTSEVMTEDRWKMKCTTDSKSFETNHVHERIKSETNDSRWTSSTFGMSAESCMHQVSNLGIISSLSAERERPHLSACQTKKTCQPEMHKTNLNHWLVTSWACPWGQSWSGLQASLRSPAQSVQRRWGTPSPVQHWQSASCSRLSEYSSSRAVKIRTLDRQMRQLTSDPLDGYKRLQTTKSQVVDAQTTKNHWKQVLKWKTMEISWTCEVSTSSHVLSKFSMQTLNTVHHNTRHLTLHCKHHWDSHSFLKVRGMDDGWGGFHQNSSFPNGSTKVLIISVNAVQKSKTEAVFANISYSQCCTKI